MIINNQKYSEIIIPELAEGAIYNDEYVGFREDYLVIHCLIKKYKPKSFFEIGTNCGTGTNIICNAGGHEMSVYSMDLPLSMAHKSLQSPESEGKGHGRIGANCSLPFTQIFCDSMEYDFSKIKCEGYFVDGEHDYQHPFRETKEILKNKPKLIIWHDSDMTTVFNAIQDNFEWNEGYSLFRVVDTRIAYALAL
jgi:hypothetical protein